jgi:FKBP-type peptidyl-prolyl cis-trans isomerase SlyD
MKIEKNLMISLVYELREQNIDGEIVEKIDDTRPLEFIFGTGRLLPAFESNLYSMSKGDKFEFSLDSVNAYGEKREEMIIDVPISVFHTDGHLDENICRVGNEVPMMDASGNPLYGIINEISDKFVKMDFNHPMAGVNLFFSGKILDVREATTEELTASNHACTSCGTNAEMGCSGSCSN